MSLATHGYDEFRHVAEEPQAAAGDRAERPADDVDRKLAEMGRSPTLIAVLWLTFYILIAFAAWLR